MIFLKNLIIFELLVNVKITRDKRTIPKKIEP